MVVVGFVVVLYAVELLDQILNGRLDGDGVRPRSVVGLFGIVWAPLLHVGWAHLETNTVPVLMLGFLALLSGIGRGLAATAVIWVVAGLGTWLIAPSNSVHLGASSLVFGWLLYLITRGFFTHRPLQILLGLALLVLYGGTLLGVLPGQQGISWQGHLFGAVGGGLAAYWLSPRSGTWAEEGTETHL